MLCNTVAIFSTVKQQTNFIEVYIGFNILVMVKGTRCLESVELVFKKCLKPFTMKCIGLVGILKVEYNDPHKCHSKFVVFL